MYVAILSAPACSVEPHKIHLSTGLFRDITNHYHYEKNLRYLLPQIPDLSSSPNLVDFDLRDYPGLSIRLLPVTGNRTSWWRNRSKVAAVLSEEAKVAGVWHTSVTRKYFDLTSQSYAIGRQFCPGLRILCLDSDPAAMLARSPLLPERIKAGAVRRSLIQRVRGADVVFFGGAGVCEVYSSYAKRWLMTDAVWLEDDELADEGATLTKFEALGQGAPLRIALPTRLSPWKGVDDALHALHKQIRVGGLPHHEFDLIGSGKDKPRLLKLVRSLGLTDRVRFLEPVPYGEPFFRLLRGYHIVLAPTRALELTRIVYDALAMGCVLIYSGMTTLKHALTGTKAFAFEPGVPDSLAEVLGRVAASPSLMLESALDGIKFMKGRTIQQMHRQRHEFLVQLRREQDDHLAHR